MAYKKMNRLWLTGLLVSVVVISGCASFPGVNSNNADSSEGFGGMYQQKPYTNISFELSTEPEVNESFNISITIISKAELNNVAVDVVHTLNSVHVTNDNITFEHLDNGEKATRNVKLRSTSPVKDNLVFNISGTPENKSYRFRRTVAMKLLIGQSPTNGTQAEGHQRHSGR